MSRTVSLTLRNAMNAQQTDEIPIVLIEIAHPDFAGTLRLSSDPTERFGTDPLRYGTTHDSNEYLFCPMSIELPDDIDERAPRARLAIENVSREIVDEARSITSPPTAKIMIVLASDPETIEVEYPEFDLENVSFNADVISVEMGLQSLEDEPFPGGTFAPSGFPGLF